MAWQSFINKHRTSKRTMGLLYIIISLLVNGEVHSEFEVMESPSPSLWITALHRCNSSRRNWTVAVPAVDLATMTVTDEIALKGEAWVGYLQSYEHILYMGCASQGILRPFVSAEFNLGRNANRPGLCYSVCGLQGYIGLQTGLCYCITTRNISAPDTLSFNSSCKKELHCRNGMFCGAKGYSNISVYQKVSLLSTDIKGDDSGCLIIKKDKGYEMFIVNCTRSYQHLCEVQTGQILNLEESTEDDQWVYSFKHCLETGRRPTTFIGNTTNFIFPNYSGTWWTSVVRDFVIRNFSESGTSIGTPRYEGFLKNSDGVIELEFVHEGNASKKKSVVCMSGQKMENSPIQKKGTALEMTSEKKILFTSTTSKPTITSGVPGRKMQNKMKSYTPDNYSTPLGSGTSESAPLETNEANARSVHESTVDPTVVPAIVGSFTSLLVISVLLNIYFIRKSRRLQLENMRELPYVNPVAREHERGRNDTISAALSTEIRSIPDTYSNISTCMVSYKSSGEEDDGYITPIIAGANVAYDYI